MHRHTGTYCVENLLGQPIVASHTTSEGSGDGELLGQPMPETDKEQFVRLMAAHGRRLYAYILSLVPNWADADEIFQETSVRLWRDFADFEPGSNFSAWATRVAYFQVLTWRKRAARSHLVFDDDILQLIAARHEMLVPFAETRHRALGDCLQELSGQSRDLLARCYAPGAQVKDVAESMGRKLPAVYKSLQRIRAALRTCVERRLKAEGVA
jgi:RNA polymerase sigma-70 factor (ECF subfamily)